MAFIVRGRLNKKYFYKIYNQLSQLLPVPAYIEKIFITDNIKHARAMFRDFPKTFGRTFAHQFEQARTPMAFTRGEIEVIVILISKANGYLKRNLRACLGTIAHEVAHVLHKREGLNEYMDRCFEKNFSEYYARLLPLKLSNTETAAIAANLGSTTSYVLKDLYMIQELASRGLGDYVVEDYCHQMLQQITPPKFYADFKTASKEQILAAIAFELS